MNAPDVLDTDAAPAVGRLERFLGRSPAAWDIDSLGAAFRGLGLRIVSLMHVGGDGWLKALDFVPQSDAHFAQILSGGERADGSSLFPGSGIRPDSSDIVLRPRLETAFVDPFSSTPTLVLLCGHIGRDGTPLRESPDTIARRAERRVADELGLELWALGEVEYFVGRPPAEMPGTAPEEDQGYHQAAPLVFGEGLRRKALAALADIGVPVKYAHSEVGFIPPGAGDETTWEQHEIELRLAPLARAADAIVITRWVLRRLAARRGMRVQFDPIMRRGHAGSGLHVHTSLVRDGRHVDLAPRGSGDVADLPTEARGLIGGLCELGPALMAFGNRQEGSLVRLGQGKEAPGRVTWGLYDRHALIRLPIQARTADGRAVTVPTVEFRLPDGSAHPHLLLAGIAQACVHGARLGHLERLLADTRSGAGAPGARPVPGSFAEVAAALREHRDLLAAGDVFPDSLLAATLEGIERAGTPAPPGL